MLILTKLTRIIRRSNMTVIMFFITIIMMFVGFHLYLKDKHMQDSHEHTEANLRNENKVPVDIPILKEQKPVNEGMR